jgi:hypothetical protein
MIDNQALVEFAHECFEYVDPDDCWIDMRNIFDLVETIAGRKPVFLRRGYHVSFMETFNPGDWGLFETPCWSWETDDPVAAWPPIMLKHLLPPISIDVLTASETVLKEMNEASWLITVEQEARWLHYPLCCIVAYHARHRRYAEHVLAAYRTASRDDPKRMKRLITSNRRLPSSDEIADVWKNANLAPMCSFAYCDRCAADANSPGQQMNREREQYFEALLPDLVEILRRMNAEADERKKTFQDEVVAEGLIWDRDVKNTFPNYALIADLERMIAVGPR